MSDNAVEPRAVYLTRTIVGLLQGLALYLLYVAYDDRSWPATNGYVFAPILLTWSFAPVLALQGLSNLRTRTLLFWIAAAILVVVSLGFYDIWHAWPVETSPNVSAAARPTVLPSFQLAIVLILGFAIAHVLVSAADADRAFVAAYPTYFDVASKLAVQLALAVAFAGVFWGLLWLGAGLFELIKIRFVTDLIEHRWFAIPASTLAVAVAIHITDVQVELVRGLRTLGLTLLSWLLPLMTLIVAGFLVTLIFTGLQPLWDTRFATTLLLLACTALIVLINATYREGDAERAPSMMLRQPGRLAALMLLPLVTLAVYALALRIAQYGWTADRIYGIACAVVAACFAIGYALSSLRRGPWLKEIERWNVYVAWLTLAVLIALFTPIADPYRISVASQIARLESGKVAPENFDFAFLRWEGGSYGHAELERLKTKTDGPRAEFVREAANRATLATNRYTRPADPDIAAKNITVHMPAIRLPPSFTSQDWAHVSDRFTPVEPACLRAAGYTCDAWMMDLDGDGIDEVIVYEGQVVWIFRMNDQSSWESVGNWTLPPQCRNIIAELLATHFTMVPAQAPKWPDLEIAGQRLRLQERIVPPTCPN